MEFLAPLARDLGLQATLALMLLLGVWRAASWTGREILLPWRNRHFAFLEQMEQAAKSQAVTLDRLVDVIDRQQESQEKHAHTLDALWLSVQALHEGKP